MNPVLVYLRLVAAFVIAVLMCGCGGSTGTMASRAVDREEPAAAAAEAMPDLSTGSVSFDRSVAPELEVKRTPTGHLLVRPTINGKQPGWFIFDTGAGICVISTAHVEQFALKNAGSIAAVGVGGASSQGLHRASMLTLGPLTLRDHPIMTTDLSFLKQYLGEEIYGVVGFGVLSVCVAELDIATPRIAIHDPAAYASARDDWQELDLADRIPSVRARFEGRDGLFRLDTGANGHVTFHEPAVKKWDLLKGRDLRMSKSGGVGGFVKSRSGVVEWFELGGVRRENVPAVFAIEAKGAFADSRMDGNIGAELLRPFVLVFDYKNARMAFVPHERQVSAPGESRQ